MNTNQVGRTDESVETFSLKQRQDHEAVAKPTQVTNKENDQNATPGQHSNGVRLTKTTAKPTSSTSTNVVPFRAYAAAETYQKRKEYRMKKILEEERQKRNHIAKPMPNFKKIHEKTLSKETIEKKVMSPETPQVLRRGLAMKENLEKKREEHMSKLAERPPIIARSTSFLKEVPFKPKLEAHVTTVEPFDLKMSERLKERKQWDDNYLKEIALRKEKEEKEKQQNEERMRKLVREQTIFKARPNPFK